MKFRTEKGSDVNLAARLLHDAHMGYYDRAIVVTGDSDLAEPIRLVVNDIGKPVWVRNPRDHKSKELSAVATSYERIRPRTLHRSQLPDAVVVGGKTYEKPLRWRAPASEPDPRTVVGTVVCEVQGCANTVEVCRRLSAEKSLDSK
ncbi:MAG: NYN domain-containing protein [Phycisphaeraceae bacterium]